MATIYLLIPLTKHYSLWGQQALELWENYYQWLDT